MSSRVAAIWNRSISLLNSEVRLVRAGDHLPMPCRLLLSAQKPGKYSMWLGVGKCIQNIRAILNEFNFKPYFRLRSPRMRWPLLFGDYLWGRTGRAVLDRSWEPLWFRSRGLPAGHFCVLLAFLCVTSAGAWPCRCLRSLQHHTPLAAGCFYYIFFPPFLFPQLHPVQICSRESRQGEKFSHSTPFCFT